MGDALSKAGLARKIVLKYKCHTCRIYLMLAGMQGGEQIKSPAKPRGTCVAGALLGCHQD